MLLEELVSVMRLSDMQKQVLCKIAASSSGEQAAQQISDGQNLIAARDILVRTGMVEFDGKKADVTQKGFDAMQDAGLIDDSKQLTDQGKKYAGAGETPPEDVNS